MRHPAAPMCGRMTAKPSTQYTLQLGISDAAAGSGLRELYRRLLLAYENHVVPKTDEELASLAGLATGTWTLLSWFWDILFASLKVGGGPGVQQRGLLGRTVCERGQGLRRALNYPSLPTQMRPSAATPRMMWPCWTTLRAISMRTLQLWCWAAYPPCAPDCPPSWAADAAWSLSGCDFAEWVHVQTIVVRAPPLSADGPPRPQEGERREKSSPDDDESPEASSSDRHVPKNISTMVCEACGGGHAEDRIVLCDHCNLGWHLFCLDPPLSAVPPGDWICPRCSLKGAAWGSLRVPLLAFACMWNQRPAFVTPVRSLEFCVVGSHAISQKIRILSYPLLEVWCPPPFPGHIKN